MFCSATPRKWRTSSWGCLWGGCNCSCRQATWTIRLASTGGPIPLGIFALSVSLSWETCPNWASNVTVSGWCAKLTPPDWCCPSRCLGVGPRSSAGPGAARTKESVLDDLTNHELFDVLEDGVSRRYVIGLLGLEASQVHHKHYQLYVGFHVGIVLLQHSQ